MLAFYPTITFIYVHAWGPVETTHLYLQMTSVKFEQVTEMRGGSSPFDAVGGGDDVAPGHERPSAEVAAVLGAHRRRPRPRSRGRDGAAHDALANPAAGRRRGRGCTAVGVGADGRLGGGRQPPEDSVGIAGRLPLEALLVRAFASALRPRVALAGRCLIGGICMSRASISFESFLI